MTTEQRLATESDESAELARLRSLLDEVESLWRSEGAAIADALAPGLSRDQMTRMATNEGLELPEQLLVWWGWHNGVDLDVPDPQRAETGTNDELISFQQALAWRADLLQDYGRPQEDGMPDAWWRPSWLPLAGSSSGWLYVDTAQAPGAIWIGRAYPSWEEILTVRAFRLADLVEAWICMITRHWVRWDRESRGWSWDNVPTFLTSSGLV